MCGVNVAYFSNQKKEVSTQLDGKADTVSTDVKKAVANSYKDSPNGSPEKPETREEAVAREKVGR
jgi:hypothetical protein